MHTLMHACLVLSIVSDIWVFFVFFKALTLTVYRTLTAVAGDCKYTQLD